MEEVKTETPVASEPVAAPVVASAGVKELKEVVDLVLEVGAVVKSALADGKVGLEDATLVFRVVPKIGPALEGIKGIPAELKDLSVEEASELATHIMAKLAVDDARAREIIEAALKVGVAILALGIAIEK